MQRVGGQHRSEHGSCGGRRHDLHGGLNSQEYTTLANHLLSIIQGAPSPAVLGVWDAAAVACPILDDYSVAGSNQLRADRRSEGHTGFHGIEFTNDANRAFWVVTWQCCFDAVRKGMHVHTTNNTGQFQVIVLSHGLRWLRTLPQQLSNLFHQGLRRAKKHSAVLADEERVVHAAVTGPETPLDDNHSLCTPNLDDRHACNGAVWLLGSSWIHDVVGAQDEGNIELLHAGIHLGHLFHDVVGNLRLRQEYVHVAWKAPRHRVNSEEDADTHGSQSRRDVGDRMLRPGGCHTIAWHHENALGLGQ
mmetsp:Transcript_107846/g.230268  ORF Transcript_107846/g.230268 Transcript_107846/m.230268 type:complete len:304 (-) Transcript_107846:1084-1995(-)